MVLGRCQMVRGRFLQVVHSSIWKKWEGVKVFLFFFKICLVFGFHYQKDMMLFFRVGTVFTFIQR